MNSCRTVFASLASFVVFVGCDSPPPSSSPDTSDASTLSNRPLADVVLKTSDAPPGTVDLTHPPTAADAKAADQLGLIMTGMNLGNFLDGTPQESSWTGSTLHGWYFEAIHEAGFDHVRIPVRWNIHAADDPPYTIDSAFFARVNWAIANTLTRNMAAVLNIHHYDEYYANPSQQHDKFLALWQQIADHYKDYPKTLFFELLNEPNGSVTADIWNADLAAAFAEIRSSNPYRSVIIGGVNWNNFNELAGNRVNFPAGDGNVIATFHYYSPYCFTTPPQTWDCSSYDNPYPHSGTINQVGVSWPVLFPADVPSESVDQVIANNETKIDNDLSSVAAWSQTSGIPVYMGEFGADTPNRDNQARGAYLQYMVQESAKYGFGWANWSFIYTFAAWDDKYGWYPDIIKALMPDYTGPTT